MATIEDLNKDYLKQNDILKKLTAPGGLKDKIEQFQEALDLNIKDYKITEARMNYFLSRNQKAMANTFKKNLETIQKDILTLRNKLEKANKFLEAQQEVVNEKFAELGKNPEIKQKLDSILYKKYERKEKQEIDRKQQLEEIKQIVDAHPNVKKWLKGIEGYEKSIRKCDKIFEKYKITPPSTPEENKELRDATNERYYSERGLVERRGDLVNFFAKNHPEIDKDILESLHSYGNISKQIAGCEKSINNYEKAMDSLSVAKQPNAVSLSSLAPVPVDKPSWFRHPIQRLKFAINERKEKRNPVPVTPNNTKSDFLDNVKLSKNEFNAEIVQKYLNEQYKENLHNAARQKDEDPNVR